MSQEVQDPNTPATKPASKLAVTLSLVVVLLLALGAYLTFGRGTDSAAGVPGKPLVEAPKGPAPTVLSYPSPEVPLGLVESPTGARFSLAGLEFLTIYFDNRWSGMDQGHNMIPKSGYPIITPDLWELQAQWRVFNGRFDCVQALKRTGQDEFTYDAKFTSEAGVQSQLICTEIHLPAASYLGQQIVVDGTALKFPETLQHQWGKVADIPSFNKLEIATSVGRLIIEGKGGLSVVDLREYGHESYSVRVHFTPERGLLTQTELHLKMKVVPN